MAFFILALAAHETRGGYYFRLEKEKDTQKMPN